MTNLWFELKRRNVFRVAIAYIIGAWLLLQVADVLVGLLALPDWTLRLIGLLLLLGLPAVVCGAWVYEVTPDGIRRAEAVDPSQSITGETGHRLSLLTFVFAIGLAGFFMIDRFVLGRQGEEQQHSAQPVTSPDLAKPADVRPSIAVLPFASRSNDEGDSFFAAGMHDELLANLARIKALKVISRTSVMRYQDTTVSIPQIAAELNVATVLEGGVQRAGDRVRINVQLIDARTDTHLWGENFDRQLTAQNLFAIQSEIATSIANALKARLTSDERKRIEHVPTLDFEAYQAYLRGRELFLNRGEGRGDLKLKQSLVEFEKAIELEPDYAEAYAGMAASAMVLPGYQENPDVGLIDRIPELARQALSLNNQLAEPWAIMALHEATFGSFSSGTKNIRRALELEPGNSTFQLWRGVLNAMLGDFFASRESISTALELDPSSALIVAWAGIIAWLNGDIDAAERHFTVAAGYGNVLAQTLLATLESGRGNHSLAIEILQDSPAKNFAAQWREWVVPAFENPANGPAAARFLLEFRESFRFADHAAIYVLQTVGQYDAALEIIRDNAVSEPDLIAITYLPEGSELRRTAGYRQILRELRLPQAWRELGWPAFCRPRGAQDFACD